jgi:hypothetical protein
MMTMAAPTVVAAPLKPMRSISSTHKGENSTPPMLAPL